MKTKTPIAGVRFTATSVRFAARKSLRTCCAGSFSQRSLSRKDLVTDIVVHGRPIYGLLKETMPGMACEDSRLDVGFRD